MAKKNTQAADELVDQASEAFEEEDVERALELAEQALEADPTHAAAAMTAAEALAELGRFTDADELLTRALKAHPNDPELAGMSAAIAIETADDEHDREPLDRALRLLDRAEKQARKDEDEPLLAELLRTRARALNALGDLKGACDALEHAKELSDGDEEILLDLAVARFELLNLDGAKDLLTRLARVMPDEPDVQHYLGLVAERRGDGQTAERHFEAARAGDPERYPEPIRLSKEEFDSVVEDALEQLPEPVKQALKDTTVMVEDLPTDADLTGDTPLSPLSLGMFRGPSVREQSVTGGSGQLPPSILLFQKNLERYARSKEELIEEIEHTVIHEVGHFVGFDEEDLYERGLE